MTLAVSFPTLLLGRIVTVRGKTRDDKEQRIKNMEGRRIER
jgi:hypothetical protein